MKKEIEALYSALRLSQYKRLFKSIKERSGSLSATEAYAVDCIYLLDKPTVKQFSDFLGISQPNATYKVNSLIAKGYIERVPSLDDKREVQLCVTPKFLNYYQDSRSFIDKAAEILKKELNNIEYNAAKKAIDILTASIDKTY